MIRNRRVRSVLLLALLLLVMPSSEAEAYVDPGSGSMLVQLLLGGLMAALVMVRSFWHRLRLWAIARSEPEEK